MQKALSFYLHDLLHPFDSKEIIHHILMSQFFTVAYALKMGGSQKVQYCKWRLTNGKYTNKIVFCALNNQHVKWILQSRKYYKNRTTS